MTKQRGKDDGGYSRLVSGISGLLDQARRATVRTLNSFLTATYWEIGRRIVEYEQGGKERAKYGEELLQRLGCDLTARFGRGFSDRNLLKMRAFYLGWEISPTPSAELEARAMLTCQERDAHALALPAKSAAVTIPSTASAELAAQLMTAFPLSWSHYVRLLSVEKPLARVFYESEAIRGGWSVREETLSGTLFSTRNSGAVNGLTEQWGEARIVTTMVGT